MVQVQEVRVSVPSGVADLSLEKLVRGAGCSLDGCEVIEGARVQRFSVVPGGDESPVRAVVTLGGAEGEYRVVIKLDRMDGEITVRVLPAPFSRERVDEGLLGVIAGEIKRQLEIELAYASR